MTLDTTTHDPPENDCHEVPPTRSSPIVTGWDVFCQRVRQSWPPTQWANVGVVVGCSGGADSVALATVLVQQHSEASGRGFVMLAHLDHQLRGEDSTCDRRFVEQLGEQLGVRVRSASMGSAGARRTDEAELRQQRLDFLRQTAESHGARYVALAHQADDQVETVIQRMMRGTGPAGLTGIPKFRGLGQDLVLVRPMLAIRRATILSALRDRQQEWREDATNRQSIYTRNWIRNELLPVMRDRHAEVDDAVLRLSQSIGQWQAVIDRLAVQWLETACRSDTKQPVSGRVKFEWTISSGDPTDSAIVVEGLKRLWDRSGWPRSQMTAKHWERIAAAIAGRDSGVAMLPGEVRLSLVDERVRLMRT